MFRYLNLGYFSLILFAGLIALPASAAPIFEVTPTLKQQSLRAHLDLYIDDNNDVDQQAILDHEMQIEFIPANYYRLQKLPENSAIWLRFSIHNSADNQRITLRIQPNTIDQYQLYSLNEQHLTLLADGGDTTVFKDREIVLPPLYQNIDIATGSTHTFYLKLYSLSTQSLDLVLFNTNYLHSYIAEQSWLAGAVTGLFVILVVINSLAFILFRRNPIYLYQAIYIAAIAGVLMNQLGYGYYVFGSTEQYNFQALVLYTNIAFICLMQIVILLNSFKPPIGLNSYTLLRLAQCAGVAFIAAEFLAPQSVNSNLANVYALVILCSVITTSLVEYIKTSNRHLLFFALIRIFGVVGILIYLSSSILEDQSNFSGVMLITFIGLIELSLMNALFFYQSAQKFRSETVGIINQAISDSQKEQHSLLLNTVNSKVSAPVSDMISIANLLAKDALNSQQREHIVALLTSGNTLLNTLDEVIDENRILSGNIQFSEEYFELNQLIQQCCDGFQKLAQQKNIELIANLQNTFALNCYGDRFRIRQIFLVLIHNAIYNTEYGEVVVSCKTSFTDNNNASITLVVKDTSHGINIHQQRQLFNHPQKQFSDEPPLAAIYHLAKLMKGDITVQSQIGAGCILRLQLDLPAKPLNADDNDVSQNLHGLTALIVDDNERSCSVVRDFLSGWDIKTDSAINASEALAKLRNKANIREAYDLLLINYELQSLNGLQLAERVKDDDQLNQLGHITILMASQLSSVEASLYREAGIHRRIEKPIDYNQLKLLLVEEVEKQNERRKTAELTPMAKPKIDRLAVLIAEDNIVSAKVLMGMFKKLDVYCQAVSNGQEALEAVQKNSFDLVFMDGEMPVLNGIEATRAIRLWEQKNNLQPTPILALTAHVQSQYKEDCIAAGMNDHLAKPVDIHQLQLVLKHWSALVGNN
ncbi:Sensor histidine kinase RcsC [Sinobacterium norvegicum]|uniref:Sensor histidine kinase RcsC n=1 Tax=Sinobacterium norvegicum TaxID=1641715 RepID=A0ABN8EIF4_9GAMM|nr:hybrid sensor histidine kinase/response regulator [Sinobacterium norvegicum]CAH0991465.1 Sensor histidine kinase RcsC [Sinobacterium norvegicum]